MRGSMGLNRGGMQHAAWLVWIRMHAPRLSCPNSHPTSALTCMAPAAHLNPGSTWCPRCASSQSLVPADYGLHQARRACVLQLGRREQPVEQPTWRSRCCRGCCPASHQHPTLVPCGDPTCWFMGFAWFADRTPTFCSSDPCAGTVRAAGGFPPEGGGPAAEGRGCRGEAAGHACRADAEGGQSLVQRVPGLHAGLCQGLPEGPLGAGGGAAAPRGAGSHCGQPAAGAAGGWVVL